MNPELKFTVTYVVRFVNRRFEIEKPPRTEIAKWPDLPKLDGKIESSPKTVAPNETRLLTEIVRQPTYPRTCNFMSAYVALWPSGGKKGSKTRTEYVAYDRVTSMNRPIVPALYGVSTDLATQLGNIGKKNKKNGIPAWVKRAAFLRHVVTFRYDDIGKGKLRIEIADEVSVYRYLLGEFCGALPLPGSFNESLEGKRAILVSRRGDGKELELSAEVWNALCTLSTIVRNDKKQIVLLKGEPGSGKEIFGQAIHYGCVRAKETKPQQLSVAGVSLDRLRDTLFGSVGEKGGVVDGLIAKAKGGTLFLDEFDKASTNEQRFDFGSALLRVLESDTYYPEGSQAERDVEDVYWILAGVFDKAASDLPRDIWSRCTDQLNLVNPVREVGYAKAMFIYWHFVETARWLQSDKKGLYKLKPDGTLACVVARWLLWGAQTASAAKASAEPLMPGNSILTLAEKFEERLVERGCGVLRAKTVDGLIKATGVRYSPSEALAVWGVRTIRQASTVVSRELRTLLIGMLDDEPDKIKKTLDEDKTTEDLMKRVDEVLELLHLGD